jgi:hypothetical protein
LTKRKPDPTPIELFHAPLVRLARQHPEIEGLVFWGGPDGWNPTPSEALEAEEIAFYSEGLLLDGFSMHWTLVALPETPDLPDNFRLEFWQDDTPPPPSPAGWVTLTQGRWTGTLQA